MAELSDVLIVTMRWLHAAAAAIWIGVVALELLVVLPAFDGEPPPALRDALDVASREIVQTALIVFLVSGAILTVERLSRGAAGAWYVALLGLKLLLAIAMFQLAFRFRRATGQRRVLGLQWIGGLGVAILFLASALKWIYERALLP